MALIAPIVQCLSKIIDIDHVKYITRVVVMVVLTRKLLNIMSQKVEAQIQKVWSQSRQLVSLTVFESNAMFVSFQSQILVAHHVLIVTVSFDISR